MSGDEGKYEIKNRDSVASGMTAAQIVKAQEMAQRLPLEWKSIQ